MVSVNELMAASVSTEARLYDISTFFDRTEKYDYSYLNNAGVSNKDIDTWKNLWKRSKKTKIVTSKVVKYSTGSQTTVTEISDEGKAINEDSVLSSLVSYSENRQVDEFTLWIWSELLSKGEVNEYYGSRGLGRNLEMLHVFLCGVDGDSSGIPHLDSWSEFGGTFSDDDKEQGLKVDNLTCSCNAIQGITLTASVDKHYGSVSGMLKAAYEAGLRKS